MFKNSLNTTSNTDTERNRNVQTNVDCSRCLNAHYIWSQCAKHLWQSKKIDVSAGKMTIIHGPIKHLKMMHDMTMVFRVAKPDMLKQVKPGDKIKFDADRVNGALTVMKLKKR